MKVREIQATTTDGSTISGELIIRFTDVKIEDFMGYRSRVRGIVGFTGLSLTKSNIEEAALTASREAARVPEYHKPPVILPERQKPFYLTAKARGILEGLAGQDQAHIVREFRRSLKRGARMTDGDIMTMFNRVHGIA